MSGRKGLTIPKLLIQCGTEDFLYEDNQQFMTYLDDKGIDYQYEEGQVNMIMRSGIRPSNAQLNG